MVYVLLYTHRHGEDISVFKTSEGAAKGAVGLVYQFVGDIEDDVWRKQIEKALADGKEEEAVELYCAAMDDEDIEIRPTEVQE